ncbi:hypothetical protein [Streptomyces europaeiscabiei]|uniref:hypothetical protein n=1 Tax=Streptomyces europaeiscabiei TaxID=146819 RepID=UPI0029B95BD0|nr:hypothetical protein [Streptomyces europaeiscabiei]MDX2528005.1 hypothetical protein [Streptomyces europaeiscabiei]MDX3549564.1 hypothetical protein [Streptomyces europaeiscabiei]
MLTAATARSHGRIDDTTSTHIADLWNAAYPVMRALTTARIDAYRRQIRDEAWHVDPNHRHADVLRAHTPTEAQLRRRLKNAEALRLTLGQLDRGTHRACTRSPGGFTVRAAYWAVRALLDVTSTNDEGLSAVYGLAAALADAADELHRELRDQRPTA